MNAPACVAILPATSLIGASSGSRPRSSSTVSYAMQVAPLDDEPLRQLGVRREVQVGEQRVPRLEPRDLDGLGLLDLDDHVGRREHRVGVGQDLRALGDVVVVGDPRALARSGLHDDAVLVQRPARARPPA